MKLVNWQYCKDLNDIDDAIKNNDEEWEGLTTADDIISITYNYNQRCYVVFWKMEVKKKMYNIYVKKRDGKGKTYNRVSTLSFSARRILVTFKDGSIIKFNPADIEEFKILSNVRR